MSTEEKNQEDTQNQTQGEQPKTEEPTQPNPEEPTEESPSQGLPDEKPEPVVPPKGEEATQPSPEEPTEESPSQVLPDEKPEPVVLPKDEEATQLSPEEPKVESPPESVPEDMPERIISLSDLQEEGEYNEEEVAFMSKLYEETMQQIKPGEIIPGKVVSISDREVAVDIGFKSEGTVPIEEFDDPESLNIGDTIEVFLEDIENQDGQLVLSKKKADFARIWDRIMGIYERGENVSGRCLRRIKGGIVVDVMGIDAFLPGSQIDIHPVRDFDAWIGEMSEFRIVKVNETRKNIVLSRKALIEENLRDVREKILGEIQIGQEVEGVVKNITDFGAFVDLGGVDGLLHITDLSWGRVNHPSELVSYDEKLKVHILDFDPIRKRISVGLKQLQPHPWEGVEERFPVNSKVKGKVVSITKYGAFVELEEGIEGLIHISEMSWTQHIKHPSQILNIGQEVEIIVLSIDVEGRKVSLGLKQTEEDPWEKLEQKYAVNSIHKGVVRDLVPFGVFVELEEGVEGLVHISDLSWTRKVRHPGEIVKKGDEIDVQILSFDRNERRIALGHKQTLENPWLLFEKKYPVGTIADGSIVRTVDKGAIVELEWSLESFLPVSHFGKDTETGRGRAFKEGEKIQIEIIDFDLDNKKIVVSAANVQKRADEAEYQAYLAQQGGVSDKEVEAPKKEKTEAAEEEKAVVPEPESEEIPAAAEVKEEAEAPAAISTEKTEEVKPVPEVEEEEKEPEAKPEPVEKAEEAKAETAEDEKPKKKAKKPVAKTKKAEAEKAKVEEKEVKKTKAKTKKAEPAAETEAEAKKPVAKTKKAEAEKAKAEEKEVKKTKAKTQKAETKPAAKPETEEKKPKSKTKKAKAETSEKKAAEKPAQKATAKKATVKKTTTKKKPTTTKSDKKKSDES